MDGTGLSHRGRSCHLMDETRTRDDGRWMLCVVRYPETLSPDKSTAMLGRTQGTARKRCEQGP